MSSLVKLAFTMEKGTLIGTSGPFKYSAPMCLSMLSETSNTTGLSMPKSTKLEERIGFLQESRAWDETTWERGFEQRKENVGDNSEKHNSAHCVISALQYKTLDLNREPEEQRAFSVTWERTGETAFKGE